MEVPFCPQPQTFWPCAGAGRAGGGGRPARLPLPGRGCGERWEKPDGLWLPSGPGQQRGLYVHLAVGFPGVKNLVPFAPQLESGRFWGWEMVPVYQNCVDPQPARGPCVCSGLRVSPAKDPRSFPSKDPGLTFSLMSGFSPKVP